MEKKAKKAAWISAIIVFFMMMAVGAYVGQPADVCVWRALAGGAAMYAAARAAGQIVIRMLIDAIAQDQFRRQQTKKS